MSDFIKGVLFVVAITLVVLFLFRDEVHFGRIENHSDTTRIIVHDTILVHVQGVHIVNLPAKTDTVYQIVKDTIRPVIEVRLDTTLVTQDSTGTYHDDLHVTYLESPVNLWQNIILLLEPRRVPISDTTMRISKLQIVHEVNWYVTLGGIILTLLASIIFIK